jgi:hypothetical protein
VEDTGHIDLRDLGQQPPSIVSRRPPRGLQIAVYRTVSNELFSLLRPEYASFDSGEADRKMKLTRRRISPGWSILVLRVVQLLEDGPGG